MALHVRADRLPFATGIKTTELYPTSQLLSSIVGIDVQPNKAIVGRNAFAHEAGIHQHGVINNPLCYEIMTPESVSVPANSLVLASTPDDTRCRCATLNSVTTSRPQSSNRLMRDSRTSRTRRNGFTIRI